MALDTVPTCAAQPFPGRLLKMIHFRGNKGRVHGEQLFLSRVGAKPCDGGGTVAGGGQEPAATLSPWQGMVWGSLESVEGETDPPFCPAPLPKATGGQVALEWWLCWGHWVWTRMVGLDVAGGTSHGRSMGRQVGTGLLGAARGKMGQCELGWDRVRFGGVGQGGVWWGGTG